ncbi:MAG: NuoM family protein [Vulcanimicrobiota bacterium]
MLSLTIFLPLLAALLVLAFPERAARWLALLGTVLTAALSLILLGGYQTRGQGLQWRQTLEWIPAVGARYDVALSGISLALVLLTTLLMVLVINYRLDRQPERARTHAALFLLMETGLLGVFCARDLLLFYLFFEVALVPMYFVIGIFGHSQRRYAALKFFLYTRAGSLAMLLSLLALALPVGSFSLDAIVAAQPLADHPARAAVVLLGLMVGFGVKLPILPLHNWLPDAHVEAPTEGSVVLAGLQLKLGAYGMLVILPTVAAALRSWALALLYLSVGSLLYGILAALGQTDLKRLVAYSSIGHMAFVLMGVSAAALSPDPAVQTLARNGAVLQTFSHGLLTGGMFFLVGMLRERTGTRELSELAGLLRGRSGWGGLTALLAFGSLGLPGLSGFIAEFQVLAATLAVNPAAACLGALGLLLATGLYLKVVVTLLLQEPESERAIAAPRPLEWATLAPLLLLSLWIGLLPATWLGLIGGAGG